MCFEDQHAAEKAVKTIVIGRAIDFPYVHDLARFLTLLQEFGEAIPDAVHKAAELTPYAAVTRYPGVVGPIAVQEYMEAIEIADAVVQWTEGHL